MLTEVQEIINNIEAFLEGNDKFETVKEDHGVSIRVFDKSGESTVYHGYELYLMKEVVKALDCTLDFKVVKDGDQDRFVVTTDANYNLVSYINTVNTKLRYLQDDEINMVYLCEKLADDCRGDFSILTGYTIGTWTRCDITKAELLYAAVNELPITQSEGGVFWFADLIGMNNKFFDELETLARSE
jgi:hypothetical protein